MNAEQLIKECERELRKQFEEAEEIALYNQEKVLEAFRKNRVALMHFSSTSGYGYDDIGRRTLSNVFRDVFRAEEAIVSPLFASGTHTISTALFGLLRPRNVMLSISGVPYDTLLPVINGEGIGSLRDFGVSFDYVPLKEGEFDYDGIAKKLQEPHSMIYLQRSRGYEYRNAFSVESMRKVIDFVKGRSKAPVVVDNCYGEFVDRVEPLELGADVIMGSLIKNPGGGLAYTGGYIAGKKAYLDLIQSRYTAPGVGTEVGSYAAGYQNYFQGIFMAPHTVLQAMKCSLLFGAAFNKLGYEVLPKTDVKAGDIVRSIKFGNADEVIAFCRAVQKTSPVDSHVLPYPWDMPGYSDQVIMAAGTFVQGASIELSADSPLREPFVVYLQGALTYEHAKIAVKNCIEDVLSINNR